MKHRLKGLESKMAQDGLVLAEAQVQALERAKAEKPMVRGPANSPASGGDYNRPRVAITSGPCTHGEFESECPGYRGAQDTFHVGNMKGLGRIFQQNFSKVPDDLTLGACPTRC